MAFGLEINEARSIYLVIDDHLLLLVRKVNTGFYQRVCCLFGVLKAEIEFTLQDLKY